ncbi:MAG: hypothetical protein ABIJ96_01640 [Elusimicrobiota bacterium]
MDCKFCGGGSWFFKLSKDGLCGDCEHLVKMDVRQRVRLIQDHKDAAEQTLNPHSKIAKMDVVVKNLDALAGYEKRGIKTMGESAAEQRDRSQADLGRLVVNTAKGELKGVLAQVRKTSDLEAKIKLLTAFQLKLSEFKARADSSEDLELFARKVRNSIYRIRLNSILETARVIEKEGDPKQAMAMYSEALKFLNSTDDPDSSREEHRARLEKKISSLKTS